MNFEPLDFSKIRTYSIRNRANKVAEKNFARPHAPGDSLAAFFDKLPRFLAANDFRTVVQAIASAVRQQRPVILMMGAHPIKCGLNPLIIEMMRRGVFALIACNGAGAVHDFELAYQGETSEDVQAGLEDGSFGMVDETSRIMNDTLKAAATRPEGGAGQALGEAIRDGDFRFRHLSILHAGVTLGVPITLHIAIGTDIVHQHPAADGAALGLTSYRDFQKLASVIAHLEGGVVLNIGSAVIMPEVFLKALTIARNLGHTVRNFTTATFDMIRQYRPSENVMRRPTSLGGQGFYLVGHHELMIPLLFAAVIEALES